jgi:hypothetical protein
MHDWRHMHRYDSQQQPRVFVRLFGLCRQRGEEPAAAAVFSDMCISSSSSTLDDLVCAALPHILLCSLWAAAAWPSSC